MKPMRYRVVKNVYGNRTEWEIQQQPEEHGPGSAWYQHPGYSAAYTNEDAAVRACKGIAESHNKHRLISSTAVWVS